MSFVSMGVAFALFLIPLILAFFAIFVVLTVSSAFLVSAVLLGMGIVLKLVNIKLKWKNFAVYSTVLLILGGVYTAMNIAYTVFAVHSLGLI